MNETPPAQGTPHGTPAPGATPPAAGTPPPALPPSGTPPAGGTPPAPVAPEKYDLKLPENGSLDQGDLDRIAAYAKAQGLSQEDAQKLVLRDNETLTAYATRQQSKLEQEKTAWAEALTSDKEIGGSNLPKVAEVAKRAISKFASPALKEALETTGLGNHPELVRMMWKIGKAMENDSTILGGGGASPKPKEMKEILYGSTTPANDA